MLWELVHDENFIKAEPVTSGELPSSGTVNIKLAWQRPKDVPKWDDVIPPKMILNIKL
ncbi:unnamed protein product, partial [Gongylonema pulchrum]|uniref:Fibronectin type-III domain-containing protein n=1 Tax=Gongylonema pulchrum TaxID=637853 RepID=A0A183ETA2_9BILA